MFGLNPHPVVAPKPRTYTPEQQAMIDELREHAKTIMLPESDPYYKHERHWLLDDLECCGRYMRAAKWKLEDAKKRIQGTLTWRREYKPDLIPPEEVRIESESGKIILNGFDIDGRPILYMRPGRENTETSPRQIRHLIFCLRLYATLPGLHDDYRRLQIHNITICEQTIPSIGVARKVLGVLQQHYVERLGRAIVVNLPTILNFFYKGISPFLDPVTRDKMRFNPNLLELIPASQLDASIGGEFNFEFEPKSYWEQIISHCKLNADGSHRRDTTPQVETNFKPNEVVQGNVPNEATESSTPTLSPSASSRASTMVDETPVVTEKQGQANVLDGETRTVLAT
ncbi:hypothetical protein RSAG8_05309, partial [Rhizoctonia solani AG-8 WAC10335]